MIPVEKIEIPQATRETNEGQEKSLYNGVHEI